MIQRAGAWLQRIVSRVMPDPFVLALGLTAAVWVAASRSGRALPLEGGARYPLASAWLAELTAPAALAFTAQIALVLVTGAALAHTRVVASGIRTLSRLPATSAQAAALVALVSCVASVVHWGFGAVIGGLFARAVGQEARARGVDVHYPLLGGAAYTGFVVWHGGLSGSAPLAVASGGHRFAELVETAYGIPAGVVPVSATIGSTLNLIVTGTLCVVLPITCALLAPVQGVPAPAAPASEPQPTATQAAGIVDRLQDRPPLNTIVGVLGLTMLWLMWRADAARFDLNFIILAFLFLGLALHRGVVPYLDAVGSAAPAAGAVLLQYPFYFGILGLMRAGGLIDLVSEAMLRVSTPQTMPVVAFLSAGLLNLVIPSGGGQWVVQGEMVLRAGAAVGADPGAVVMAFAYGDAWTNLIQPFWALPVLGLMGLRARDIIGYTSVSLIVMGVTVPALLLLCL